MRHALLLLVAGLAVGAPALAQGSQFRVRPYLQSPTTSSMIINWFTVDNVLSTLTVSGGGLASPIVFQPTPELLPLLDYQFPTELAAGNFAATAVRVNGVNARNYKHSAAVTGLTPGTTYTYTVQHNGETHTRTFETAPAGDSAAPIRLAVLSDSETLVAGRTRNREWARTTPQAPGSTGRPAGSGIGRDTYFYTETAGYRANIAQIKQRTPDLIVMPGDLIEGTATEQQRRWDEFWRHNAGEYDTLLSNVPLVAAIGNNCIFNGTTDAFLTTNQRIQFARNQWSAYFDFPSNGSPSMQDLYFRTDYGKITILTLCVVKATEEANHLFAPDRSAAGAPLSGASFAFPSRFPPRDTNRAWFDQLYTFGDMPDFNVGTTQWQWTLDQLAAARAAGQVIFVQWHHTPYSRGVHGSFVTSNQSGEATRIYTPVFEQFRVAGVFCGHSEVKERSFVDADNDGYGINYWDVGAAGDGLRGVEDAPGSINPAITAFRTNFDPNYQQNPFSQWSADQSEPELWNGNRLLGGGKHYGFLEVNVTQPQPGIFRVEAQPYHVFPVNDGNFNVVAPDFRPYRDLVVLQGPADNLQRVTVTPCAADCDRSGDLSPADFTCFLGRYRIGDPVANCDGSTTAPFFSPGDFSCFLERFRAGCN